MVTSGKTIQIRFLAKKCVPAKEGSQLPAIRHDEYDRRASVTLPRSGRRVATERRQCPTLPAYCRASRQALQIGMSARLLTDTRMSRSFSERLVNDAFQLWRHIRIQPHGRYRNHVQRSLRRSRIRRRVSAEGKRPGGHFIERTPKEKRESVRGSRGFAKDLLGQNMYTAVPSAVPGTCQMCFRYRFALLTAIACRWLHRRAAARPP